MSKKDKKEDMTEDFKSVMNSVTNMNSLEFSNTLEKEKQKMLSLKKQFPNNPLFSQMSGEDFDISQDEFVDMCKLILTGNVSETLSNAFNFMDGGMGNGDDTNLEDVEGSNPNTDEKEENNNDIEG